MPAAAFAVSDAPGSGRNAESSPSMKESGEGGAASSRVASLLSAGSYEFDATWEIMGQRLKPYFGSFVDSIVVAGNSRTRRITILREMATKSGRRFDEELIRRDASFLRGLGYFSDVDISAEETAPGRCLVTVRVVERPRLFMKYPYPVVNYDFEDGISYGFKWRIRNFRGLGEELSVSVLKRRERDHGGSFGWNIPWMTGRRLQFNVGFFNFHRLEEPAGDDFIKERNGGQVFVGVPLSKSLVRQLWVTTVLAFERRDSRLSLGETNGAPGDFYRQNYLSTGLSLHYDSRDNRLTPNRGFYSRLSVQRYNSVHGLDQSYIMYGVQNHLFIPAGPAGNLIIALDGIIREGDLPDIYEMGLGGASDLRGFTEDVGVGRVKALGTLQLRKRLFGPRIFNIPKIGKFDVAVNAVLFVDNGAIMDSIKDADRAVYHTTGGFGFEILSPIQDLIKIELAMDDEFEPILYFTSGSRF